ncbi:pantoate--beta-alanine ligase [Paenibacillus darwinianus]|uniref:Pantothenate synthetase n=1 Tax=Paenibacillus darwinianus TaxID=1380763 RepID=A0A9W5W887_9BACL|nr:pantoate--beta-alanine ligase [Paenibacillus darwinianus]EXX91253.1 pantoate--beta-alanine ligase [Paenibacillus darwinianus]EXX92088.1 pantoate--beta-alanine ligase [Paenibacillus darwinianus]EXX92608.1 pantoate--beta-alanine ligase [Paenibacillus darwinianus]
MQTYTSIRELRGRIGEWRKANPEGTVGFVPTMGFLHEGHASLIERARAENGLTVVSVFVNPLQFGPNEDFERYPRDPERDASVCERAGADLLFAPEVREMYPKKAVTRVLVEELTDRLCGASRPGHFDGVGTVVSKLFHIVQPDRAYFGLKDAQQVAVIERMTEDLNLPVGIVPCPTVREPDGLALSSRNVYLTAEQREQAVVLSRALGKAGEWLSEPELGASELRGRIIAYIERAPLAVIDYVEVLTYPDLQPPDGLTLSSGNGQGGRIIVALAVKFGGTRLIDNRIFG